MAGTLLAFDLLEKGNRVSIISSKNIPYSSKVAAGLFNPVVFKRLVASWRANEFIPFLNERYAHLEETLQCKFLHKVDISKLIESENELALWLMKKDSDEIKSFVGQDIKNTKVVGVQEELRFGTVEQSGYVDLKVFLDSAAAYFKQKANFIAGDFDFNELQFNAETPIYKGVNYDAIVFCEGYNIRHNPYFSFLPFKHVNGDVLTLQIPSYQYKKCFNKNFFLVPLTDGNYRLGATYNWTNLVFEPNEIAKEDLLSKLKEYIKGEIIVVKHEAGVRPSSSDRRPIIGAHPKHKNLHVFNGLGAKGVMLAPYFAAQLAAHLTSGQEIEKEVSIERFYHLQQSL